MVKQIFPTKDGRSKIFLDFSAVAILRGSNDSPERVLDSLEAASGSSLTDDGYKICSRGAIKRLHSIHSIFRLLKKKAEFRDT